MSYDPTTWTTDTVVIEWKVEVTKTTNNTPITTLIDNQSIKTKNSVQYWTPTLNEHHYENIKHKFKVIKDIRGEETVSMIKKEIENRQLITANNPIAPTWNPTWNPAWIPTWNPAWNPVWNPVWNPAWTNQGDWTNQNANEDWTTRNEDWTIPNQNQVTTCTFIVDWEEMCNEKITLASWNELPLYAYAPYNIKWNINLYKESWKFTLKSSSIIGVSNPNNLPWYCANNSTNKHDSFCIDWNTKWIMIDKDNNNDDFIKYSNLDLNWNFAIEMRVRVPESDNKTHYLLHAWPNFKFYIYDWYLYYKKWTNTSQLSNLLQLNIWQFNTVSIKKEWSEVSLKVNGWSWVDTGMTFNDNIENLYVWAVHAWWDIYMSQINDIIDYVKIYK